MLPTPYYQDDQTTIYLGDSCEIFPQLGHFDAVVTDPPYGIGESNAKRAKSRSTPGIPAGKCYEGLGNWDTKPPAAWLVDCLRHHSRYQILFGGNYFNLPATSCWLVWDKDNGATDFADCELAWTNLKRAVRRTTYRWNGYNQQPGVPKEFRLYPTQKPVAVMEWALGWLPDGVQTICDPFCGSGSTLLAARKMGGVKTVGIDKEEAAVEIAVKTITGEINRYRTGGKVV